MNQTFLNNEEQSRIGEAVSNAESTTAGEIRVVVVKKSSCKGDDPVYANAVKAFNKYGLHTTKDKTGILIFLSIEEQEIKILADEGINTKIEQHIWDGMVLNLVQKIHAGHTCDGICEVVKQIGELLTLHFPIQPDDTNELPNKIVIEE